MLTHLKWVSEFAAKIITSVANATNVNMVILCIISYSKLASPDN